MVTLAIGLLWIAVAVVDRSSDRIMADLFRFSAERGVRDESRRLFMQYCLGRHGDEKHCRKYSSLVWTGFPTKTSAAKAPAKDVPAAKSTSKLTASKHKRHHGRPPRRGAAPLDAAELKTLTADQSAAEKARKELEDCGHSRRCFVYKDIVWQFMEKQRTSAASFSTLANYQAYRHAVDGYRLDLQRLCRRYDCLVRGNVTLPSLAAAQYRHGGFLHLASNLVALIIFGIYVEQRTNRLLYLGVLVAGGTIGMAVHTLFFGSGDTLALGGSANVSAVMGMFYVFFFHRKMRFQVWLPRKLYLGTAYWADVKYCFPLLFVLSDIAGGFDSGFTSLITAKVAHFAHLAGLLTGVAAALIIVHWRRLPASLLYEGEQRDMVAMLGSRDAGEALVRAQTLLRYNPENAHAMAFASSAFLASVNAASQAQKTLPPRLADLGRRFLQLYLPTVSAIKTRRGELQEVCGLLDQMPLYLPFKSYLSRLGQVNTLRLGDFAWAHGRPILALRLYDSYVSRFPLAVQGQAVEESATRLIGSLPPSAANIATLTTYLTHHPDSLLSARLGAWITNAKVEAAQGAGGAA